MFLETKKEGEARTTIEPWRKLLLAAADHMEKYGWCCGFLESGRAVCARGALFRAQGLTPPSYYIGPPNEVFREADQRLSDFVGEGAACFNNRQESGTPVIAAMRACASR